MWLLFALSGPVFWAASTHIDKYLVERYFKHADTAVLMVFTAIIGVAMLPFIAIFAHGVFTLPYGAIVVMTASGAMYMGAMLFYLRAIQSAEASVVAPLFQTSIVWGYLLAYLVLGETLTVLQLLGAVIVVGAGALVSFHPGGGERGRVHWRIVAFMLAATFVLALSSVVFKYFAVEEAYWPTTFWTFVGEGVFGVGILCVPRLWREFVDLLRRSTGPLIAINGANELINLGGGLGARFAFLFAPVVVVQAIMSTTTLFVFVIGILLTLFLPSLGREDLSRANLARKGTAALLAATGIALMTI